MQLLTFYEDASTTSSHALEKKIFRRSSRRSSRIRFIKKMSVVQQLIWCATTVWPFKPDDELTSEEISLFNKFALITEREKKKGLLDPFIIARECQCLILFSHAIKPIHAS